MAVRLNGEEGALDRFLDFSRFPEGSEVRLPCFVGFKNLAMGGVSGINYPPSKGNIMVTSSPSCKMVSRSATER